MSGPTKAQLTEQAQRAEQRAEFALGQAAKAEEQLRNGQANRDAEAVAIEKCVKALATIDNGTSDPFAHVLRYGSSKPLHEQTSVERALTYLRLRFGLPDPTGEADQLRRRVVELTEQNEQFAVRLQNIRESVAS